MWYVMEGADRSKYGRCIADMNNNYLSGNDLYPKSVVAAMTYLSHFSSGEKGSSGVTFAHYGDNRTCYRCGEKGHIAADCEKSKMNA